MKNIIFITLILSFSLQSESQTLYKLISKDKWVEANAMLDKKANLDVTNNSGYTPLMFTLLNGGIIKTNAAFKYKSLPEHLKFANRLIEKGANLNKIAADGNTAFHLAVTYGFGKIAEHMLEGNIDLGKHPDYIHLAAKKMPEIAIKLLKKGGNIDYTNEKNYTVLHQAALGGDAGLVGLLIGQGADIQARINNEDQNFEGFTPLHLAAMEGHYACVQILIEAGADINSSAPGGTMALHLASQGAKNYRSKEAPKKANGKPRKMAAYWIETPVKGGNFETVKTLAQNGANINAYTSDKVSPFLTAVYFRDAAKMNYLLEQGAEMHPVNIDADWSYASALACLAYAVHHGQNKELIKDCLNKAANSLEMAAHFNEKLKQKTGRKIAGTILLNAASATAARYQANSMAKTYGYGYATYETISTFPLNQQKRIYKNRIEKCRKLKEVCLNLINTPDPALIKLIIKAEIKQ